MKRFRHRSTDRSLLAAYGITLAVLVVVAFIATSADAATVPPDAGGFTWNALAAAVPLLAAAAASALLALFRTHIAPLVPDRWIPTLLPIAGALVAALAQAAGFDIGDFNAETASLTGWQTVIAGALSGFAMTGIHQAQRQIRKRE